MNLSRRPSSEQVSNQDTPMYFLPSLSRSFDTLNQLRLDVDVAQDRRHNHETQMNMDIDCALYGELQAAELFGLSNNIQYNMNFQL